MQKRQLGRTNHESTLAIFGAAAFYHYDINDQEKANEALDFAYQAGVNHIDVAPGYGPAETLVGRWLPQYRHEFFLGSKTERRDRDAAWAEFEQSLEKLQTDQLDLYQLHAVTSMEELNEIMQPGGAIEALQQAREQKLTRNLGITGHGMDVPAVQLAALERFDFDTVMFPINPALFSDRDYHRNAEKLLQVCIDRNLGVMAIKSIAKQAWGDRRRTYNTWYEPYNYQEMINAGVRFVLSQPGVTAIPTAADVKLLSMVLNAVESYSPMSAEEQTTWIEKSVDLAPIFA